MLGTPRSSTSWLQPLLSASTLIARVVETQFFSRHGRSLFSTWQRDDQRAVGLADILGVTWRMPGRRLQLGRLTPLFGEGGSGSDRAGGRRTLAKRDGSTAVRQRRHADRRSGACAPRASGINPMRTALPNSILTIRAWLSGAHLRWPNVPGPQHGTEAHVLDRREMPSGSMNIMPA